MKLNSLLLFAFTLILGCTEETNLTKPLLDFIPENASAVIKINDLTAFKTGLSSKIFLNDLGKTKNLKEALKKIRFLDFLHSESRSILAFVPNDTGDFESVYFVENPPELIVQDSIENPIIEELDFKGIPLITYTANQNTFYQAKLGTKFVISSSAPVIEVLLENLKNNKAPETFTKLYQIANSYKPATLYLNVKKSNPFLRTILKSESKIDISTFSDWISLDFNPKTSQVNLTGISVANDSIWSYIDLFANTIPVTAITPRLAPEEIDVLIAYTFDYGTFKRNQKAFLGQETESNPLFETVEEVGTINSKNRKAVVLNTHGPELLAAYLDKNKKGNLDYQGSQIIRLQDSDLVAESFKPLVQGFKSNFCTFIDDAFVFSETRAFLEEIISSRKGGATYDKGKIFQGLKKLLAEESNVLFISNSTSLRNILKNEFSADFTNELNSSLKSQYDIGAQITADKNFYHTNIIIKKNQEVAANQAITELFKIKLDTVALTPPQFVTNHLTKKKEIVVQDLKNVLYLISSDGKVLWKKQLNGQIQGTIKQVDIFKNGRLQLAFTTNNQFMVMDRNGKEVKRFTTSYDGGGLNSLAVFDYERKKNYRFVVTQGKKIFMYDSKAKIVKGFKYTEAEAEILDAPKHIVIANKDHLVFKLKNGNLKILNRVGDVRVKVNEKIDFSNNQVFLNKDKFVVTDKKGTLYQIDQKGKITKTNLNLSTDHGMFATANTLVLMNDNILSIRGKKVELELGVYSAPTIFYINNKIYVNVTDLQSEKVYLFDSQAKPIPNFPVLGDSPIDLSDMNNDKTLEMVVIGQDNKVTTYKLN